jgi:DNA polymerase III sliding clamp (beta) subunit (PCNA family)
MEIMLKLNELQAVAYAMAKGDTRYYLNGLYLELDAEGHHRLVATDGSRVHIVDNGLGKVDKSYIIPREAVEQVLKTKAFTVTFSALSNDEGIFRHSLGGLQFKFYGVKYPDYRRVIPETLQEIQAGKYDMTYLNDALKAKQAYKQKKQGVTLDMIQQGEGLGVAVYERLFIGIMACRVNMTPVKAEASEMLTRIRGGV